MSVVTGLMVLASVGEDGPDDGGMPFNFDRLNDWMESRGLFRPLGAIEDDLGGDKHPQFCATGAGLNYFPEEEFAAFFLSLDWRHPENAVLIMQPEQGVTKVIRPAF